MVASWLERLGISLLVVAVSTVGYFRIAEHHASTGAGTIALEVPLDAQAPLIPGFVFAYLLYFVWLLLPLPILPKRADFYRAMSAFVLVQLCAVVSFSMLPSYMLRPVVETPGLSADLVRAVYALDGGWNLFPSLHVGHSVLVALLYWVHRRRLFPLVALGTVLISASTVLIKQHYVVDIPAGALLAWACYRAAGVPASAVSANVPLLQVSPTHGEPAAP